MTRSAIGLLVVLALLTAVPLAQDQERLFKAAMNTELVEGDLRAAIEQYRRVSEGADRALAAQALVRMAECYEKLGDAQAQTVYQRVMREFADQPEAATTARARLGGAETRQQPNDLALRKVWDGHVAGRAAARVLTSVSADGLRLPYIGAEGIVFLHDSKNGTDRPLTPADRCGGPPVISRDGTLVAYERYCGRFGSDLRLVDVPESGMPTPRILYENADVGQITPMDISPDKTLIAVSLVRKDRTRQIGLVATADGTLRVLKSVDWRPPTRIFFSPDGLDLAFDLPASDTSNQRDVFVLAVDGSREVPVVVHPANDKVMGWSPDGNYLLFASDRRGAMGLWAQALTSRTLLGKPALITQSINSDWSLGVTSAGALYLGSYTGDRDLYVAPIDLTVGKLAGPPTRPIQAFLGTNMEPAWSPDGKFLAYISWRTNNPIFGDPRVLGIRSVDTGETRELRPNLPYFDQMSWAPDSHALVTGGTDLKGRDWVLQIDARTGEVATLVPLPLSFEQSFPQWAPDGRHIYYRMPLNEEDINGDVAFIERDLVSGAEREVARGALGAISLSPDGRWIAARRDDPSTPSVVLIPVEGGEARELLRVSQSQGLPVRFSGIPWTPDGRSVLVRRSVAAGSIELWRVPIMGEEPRKLDIDVNQWANGNRGFISLSPDGRQLAFLTGESYSDVWVLENFLPPPAQGRESERSASTAGGAR